MLAGRFYSCRPTGGPAYLHGGVCASAECQCCEHAREAIGSQPARRRSIRQGVPRIIWLQRSRYQRVPHRPWRQKHQCPVRCRAIIYWATAAIYGEALDSHFRPYLLQGRTSEAKNDCNKKSTPLDKTTSKQPVLTSRDAARPDVRLRTRFGTPASPSIEHRSTAAAAPRLGRSSKLTPLACSECIAAAADGRSSRRVVRRTSCPRCRRAAAQLKFLGEAMEEDSPDSPRSVIQTPLANIREARVYRTWDSVSGPRWIETY